jgi:hypothetical protein
MEAPFGSLPKNEVFFLRQDRRFPFFRRKKGGTGDFQEIVDFLDRTGGFFPNLLSKSKAFGKGRGIGSKNSF